MVDAGFRAKIARLVDEYGKADRSSFLGARFDAGLAWVHFPQGHGGLGLPRTEQIAVEEEFARLGAPATAQADNVIGYGMAAPTILDFGTDEQRNTLLRPIFTGEDIWCQLFSEPGAGSDLAAVATRAVRDGEDWIVTGQKVWTSFAHVAKWAILLARTDPEVPKHRGLTYFIADMTASGVEVRPLRQLTGEAEFNEVYMTEVRVPDSDRIGDVGEGWRVAMTTLSNERTTIGGGGGAPPRGSGSIAEAVRIWHEEPHVDKSAATKDRLMQLWIRAEALRLINIRGSQNRKAGNPGPEGSIAKLMFAEINQDIYELCVDLLGPAGLVDYDYTMVRSENLGLTGAPGSSRKMFLRSQANSIEGGTSSIQRNILGERILGLPGEPRTDKAGPWKDVPRS